MFRPSPRVAALFAALFLVLPGCAREEPQKIALDVPASRRAPSSPPEQVVRIAVGGMITPREGMAYYRDFLRYLEGKIGVKVAYVDREGYAEINEMLRDGRLEAAFVCSGPYVDGHADFGLELLAAPQAYGKTVYHSYIIVPKGSPARTFADLRGKRFAFTDPLSNSGKLVPTYMLARMNETPESFFREYVFTKAHDKSIKAVAQQVVDGAAVDSLIWEYLNATNPEFTAQTRILEKSPPYAIPPVAVPRGPRRRPQGAAPRRLPGGAHRPAGGRAAPEDEDRPLRPDRGRRLRLGPGDAGLDRRPEGGELGGPVAFLSLRRKILLGLLATTLLFAALMVGFAHTVVRGQLVALLTEKGVAIARKIAADCVSPVITERYFEIEMLFKDLQASEGDLVYAYVLGEDGRELVHTFSGGVPAALKAANPVPPSQEVSARKVETDRGPVLDVGVPLLQGQAGVLHLGLSEVRINEDVNRIVALILLVAALSLVIGGVVSVVFSRYITRPLLTLSGAAEAFGRGESRQPVAVESEDEIGELAKVFNLMVENRQRAAEERERLIGELRQALGEVKALRGILPICSSCKKVRSDQGSWQQIESYIREHSDAEFSHGICPECAQRLYPEYWDKISGANAPESPRGG